MKEIIQIGIGKAGVKIQEAVWEQLCYENLIDYDGQLQPSHIDPSFNQSFMTLNANNKFIPRSIFVDTDNQDIDSIKKGSLKSFFNEENMINLKEDSSNIYSRAKCNYGRILINTIMDRVRREVEQCDSPDGILIHHSICGGTGSGLYYWVAQEICNNYRKLSIHSNLIYPSGKLKSQIIVEPYNAVLAIHELLEYSTVTLMNSNIAIDAQCDLNQKIENSTLKNYNEVTADVINHYISPIMYQQRNKQISSLKTYEMNLCPYPRIHFLLPSLTYSKVDGTSQEISNQLMNDSFSGKYLTIHLNKLDLNQKMVPLRPKDFSHLNSALVYRGNILQSEIQRSFNSLKKSQAIKFVDFINPDILFDITSNPPRRKQEFQSKISAFGLHNDLRLENLFRDLGQEFDQLFDKRAYVHWFVAEGMEHSEFVEAREDMAALEKDYWYDEDGILAVAEGENVE